MKAIEKFNVMFDDLVPPSGPAETVAGEIVRAANRIAYRWYNDGDKIGVGYGEETCREANRYLINKGGAKIRKVLFSFGESDEAYSKMIDSLIEAVVETLEEKRELLDKPNLFDFDEYV